MATIVWHRTQPEAADAILRDGFRDGTGNYLTNREHTGVWLSDVPLDENEGAHGSALLRVEIDATEEELDRFEWIEEGKSFREWLIPAAFLKERARITRHTEEDE